MSLISIGMNLLLAGLLVAAMVVGLRLNKRLKALRDSHEGFEAAVVHLNMAARRAEQGLADLRAATDEATEVLSDRIEKGRTLAAKLEKLVSSAPELPRAMPAERPQSRGMPPVSPPARTTAGEDRLAALLAMARARLQEQEAAQAGAERRPPERAAERAAERAPVERAPAERPRILSAEPLVGRAPLHGRRPVSIDDDLFADDEPLTLDRFAGAGR